MPQPNVEFISATFPNASTELNPIPGSSIDPAYLERYARSLDDYAFNYTLVPYDSSYFDPWTVAATIIAHTKNLKVIIALRPNTLYPTLAAKALATLDQISSGRVVVHFIAGGNDVEQAREGDFLTKTERYERLEEFIKICKRAWSSTEAFDWEGKHYTFKGFRSLVVPFNGKSIPVSVGGSSDDAYRVGGSLGDIFGLWGEPLKETKEQIDRIYEEAAKVGRSDRPRIWVTFRPIVAETEDLAWAKAHKTLDTLNAMREAGKSRSIMGVAGKGGAVEPQNVGSQRLLEIAKRGEVQDRALWYPTVTATGARGASTALVGSYQTVVDSILDYVDLGCELISIRGYDNLNDSIDYGRYILPGVRKILGERAEKEVEETAETNTPEAVGKVADGTNGVEEVKPVEAPVEITVNGTNGVEKVNKVDVDDEVKLPDSAEKSEETITQIEEVKTPNIVEGSWKNETVATEKAKGDETIEATTKGSNGVQILENAIAGSWRSSAT